LPDQKPESARKSFGPVAAGAIDARDRLVGEAQHPARRVRRARAQPDVQHLTGLPPEATIG